jgi:hypothetical protein
MYMGMDGTVHLDEKTRKKAIRLNPKYAYSVPWHRSFGKIATLLGFSRMSPDAGAFADGVAKWQASKVELKIDGILGPNTWKIMQPETNFTDAAAALLDPAWLKETPHKAQSKPAQGGRKNTGNWVGVSAEVCWMAGAAGRGMTVQQVFSVDDPQRSFIAWTDRVKIGVGAGYGVSASAVLMTNVYNPQDLIGKQFGSYDFNLSLGSNVMALLRTAIKAEKVAGMVKTLKKINEMERARQKSEALKAGRKFVQFGGSQIEALLKFGKEGTEALSARGNDGPTVSLIAFPIPGMVEISLAYVDDKYEFIDY